MKALEKEYAALMFPMTDVFDWDKWQDGFDKHWRGDQNESVREEFRTFKRQVLENFKYYRVPVIALDRSTTKDAVCIVFEKVNTGGKPLDAFELVTAMYAASGHELRKDWYGDDTTKGRHRRFTEALRPAGMDTGIIRAVVGLASDRRDEPISPSGYGVDVATRTFVVAESFAQRRDVDGQDALFDGGVGPHLRQEVVLGHEAADLADEQDQDVVGFW